MVDYPGRLVAVGGTRLPKTVLHLHAPRLCWQPSKQLLPQPVSTLSSFTYRNSAPIPNVTYCSPIPTSSIPVARFCHRDQRRLCARASGAPLGSYSSRFASSLVVFVHELDEQHILQVLGIERVVAESQELPNLWRFGLANYAPDGSNPGHPVIDDHRLVGVVAQADVAKALPTPDVGDLLKALSTD